MTTHYIRLQLGNLTQKQFSEMYNISKRTVENWDSRGTMPVWVGNLFYENISLKNEVEELRKKFEVDI